MSKSSTQRAYEISRLNLTPSVYYAESVIRCSLDNAWRFMLDYKAWNPSFIGADVEHVAGEPGSVGEVVLIKKSHPDAMGVPIPPFYAETVKLIPNRRIVWYVYPEHPINGNGARNFVDFGLTEVSGGVRFNIDYYAQNPVTGELLQNEREYTQSGLQALTVALKEFCEKRV